MRERSSVGTVRQSHVREPARGVARRLDCFCSALNGSAPPSVLQQSVEGHALSCAVMAMTPAYALAHVFIPNLLKLKGASTVISALERKEKTYLDQLWSQAHVVHEPQLSTSVRDPYRIAVFTLPVPKELGEAHLVGLVVKQGDPAFARYFTLEHDHVLAKKADRTLLCEREGQSYKKHGEGPVLTGTFATDAAAFIDAFMELIVPTRVARK